MSRGEHGDSRYNLVIVHTPGEQALSDWEAVAAKVRLLAPEIDVRIVDNKFRNLGIHRWQASRPSVVFSASVLRKFVPRSGKVFSGGLLTKYGEILRFSSAGVRVPKTGIWRSPDQAFQPEVWGEQVIVKPLIGWKGTGIELLPVGELKGHWDRITGGGKRIYMVQRYIDSGPRPNHYRVLTALGVPLYMAHRWALAAKNGDARAPGSPDWRLVSNDAEEIEVRADEEILAFARQMANALPQVAVLGCDIVREAATGLLYAMEGNNIGQTWHFSSDTYVADKHRTGELNYYGQFGALDLLAAELVRRVRTEACVDPRGDEGLVQAVGIEPTTYGSTIRRSTN